MLLIFLTMVSFTKSQEYADEEFIPGDMLVSPIPPPNNLSFSAVENLSNMEEIDLAVPFTQEEVWTNVDSTSGIIIDIDALGKLIKGSENFVYRTYQPIDSKDIFNQSNLNDVLVTGPLAVKWNLQIGDTLKLEFRPSYFTRFEVEVQVGGIISGIYNGPVFSEALFLSKDLYMHISGLNELNISPFGFFLDIKNEIQSADELASLVKSMEKELNTRLRYIHTSRSIDPQGRIMQENGWGFGPYYFLGQQQFRFNYWMNHVWVFLVVFPAATVLMNIIDLDILEILRQRGLNRRRFMEQYRKAEMIGVLLSALSFGVAYYSWRAFWLVRRFTSHPSVPWLFEKELLKAAAWFIGYAIVGWGIINVKTKRYEVKE